MNRIFPNELDTMPRENGKILRNLDLIVFTLSGGGKRSSSHLERILRVADERLAIKRSIRSFNLLFSFAEVSLKKQLLGTVQQAQISANSVRYMVTPMWHSCQITSLDKSRYFYCYCIICHYEVYTFCSVTVARVLNRAVLLYKTSLYKATTLLISSNPKVSLIFLIIQICFPFGSHLIAAKSMTATALLSEVVKTKVSQAL